MTQQHFPSEPPHCRDIVALLSLNQSNAGQRHNQFYMTMQQQPFFSSASSTPILATRSWLPVPDPAPVYDDISLLYLRISRTMS